MNSPSPGAASPGQGPSRRGVTSPEHDAPARVALPDGTGARGSRVPVTARPVAGVLARPVTGALARPVTGVLVRLAAGLVAGILVGMGSGAPAGLLAGMAVGVGTGVCISTYQRRRCHIKKTARENI